jgi:hypothetical protein
MIDDYEDEVTFDDETDETEKTCYLCQKKIPKRYRFGYQDIVWEKRKYGNSRAIRYELGKVFENNSFRMRYFFHRKCKRMFLRMLRTKGVVTN